VDANSFGVYDPTDATNPATTGDNVQGTGMPDGGQVGYLYVNAADPTTGIYQILTDTLVANQHYTLTVYLGTFLPSLSRPDAGYNVELMVDTNSTEAGFIQLASEADVQSFGAPASWFPVTVNYDSTSLYAGQNLVVRIRTTKVPVGFEEKETLVDAVSLTSEPIPEPSSLGILALGILAVARRARKTASLNFVR
jgi:hypothetical protein